MGPQDNSHGQASGESIQWWLGGESLRLFLHLREDERKQKQTDFIHLDYHPGRYNLLHKKEVAWASQGFLIRLLDFPNHC